MGGEGQGRGIVVSSGWAGKGLEMRVTGDRAKGEAWI